MKISSVQLDGVDGSGGHVVYCMTGDIRELVSARL